MFANFKDKLIEDLSMHEEDHVSNEWFISVSFMAKYNRLDLLEIVFSETDQFIDCSDFASLASINGNLNAIKFLSAQGAKFESDFTNDFSTVEYAAVNGHLDVLKWLHLNRSEGCDEDYTLFYSAKHGHFEVVKFLIETGICGKNSKVLKNGISIANHNYFREILSYLRSVLDGRNKRWF